MNNEVVIRGTLAGGGRPSDLVVRDGCVEAVRKAGKRRANLGSADSHIMSTLFDIQVNGAAGINLQDPALTVEDVARLNEHMLTQGVSLWIPTLITGPMKSMEHGCRVLAEAMNDRTLRRHIPGIHLEGPFISPEDGPRGAHPRKHVRKPSLKEFDRLMRAAGNRVLYTTVAPEQPGAIPFIRGVVKRGVAVSLGHHNAPAEIVDKAAEAGAILCTHLGNGLSATIHRHHNPLWPQLANERLAASLIADLHHLTPSMLKTFVAAKNPEQIVLTSDCMHIAGLKPGKYDLMGQPVELTKDQRINLVGTNLLAGSALMLLQGVVNAAEFAGMTLQEAAASASSVPARLLGVSRRFTEPAPRRKADFVLFRIRTRNGKPVPRIEAVFASGKRIV